MRTGRLPIRIVRANLVLAIGLGCAAMTAPAGAQAPAQVTDRIQQLESALQNLQQHYETQLRGLQRQLDEVKAAQAAPPSAPTPAPATTPPRTPAPTPAAAAPPPRNPGEFDYHGVKLTLGGFVEGVGIFRSRNLTADLPTPWNAIPLPNSPNYHLSEVRGTARQSRLSLLAQGAVDQDTALAGYFESDFLAAGSSANSVESNSYSPRLRQGYASFDSGDDGLHILGGQAWSLLTSFQQGLEPRRERVPLTIDAQTVPGFTWTRQPQLRVVKNIGKEVAVGVSLESPQASVFSGPNAPLVPTTFGNAGGAFLNPDTTYSTDPAPDLIAKVAFDPGWGHYELYGIGRMFRSRAGARNDITTGGGIGAGAILPLIPNRLDLQANVLAGAGIGRYGTSLLPDVTVKPSGVLSPVPEIQALVGLVGHPTESLDLYLYGGTEQAGRMSFTANGKPYGYGNALYDNTGCLTERSTVCAGNTSGIWQATIGGWYTPFQGSYGRFQVGTQLSYTQRLIFRAIGPSPATDETVVLASVRYYPF
jgi:hypothetical protein